MVNGWQSQTGSIDAVDSQKCHQLYIVFINLQNKKHLTVCDVSAAILFSVFAPLIFPLPYAISFLLSVLFISNVAIKE